MGFTTEAGMGSAEGNDGSGRGPRCRPAASVSSGPASRTSCAARRTACTASGSASGAGRTTRTAGAARTPCTSGGRGIDNVGRDRRRAIDLAAATSD
jgi:hypothetical protein